MAVNIIELERRVKKLESQMTDSWLRNKVQAMFNSFTDFMRFFKGELEFDNFVMRKRPAKNLSSTAGSTPVVGDVMEMFFKSINSGNAFNHLFIGRQGDESNSENIKTNYIELQARRNPDSIQETNNYLRNGRITLGVDDEDDGSARSPQIQLVDIRALGLTGDGIAAMMAGSGDDGIVAIGRLTSTGALDVKIYITSAGMRLFLNSPNGSEFEIVVDDTGTLSTTPA